MTGSESQISPLDVLWLWRLIDNDVVIYYSISLDREVVGGLPELNQPFEFIEKSVFVVLENKLSHLILEKGYEDYCPCCLVLGLEFLVQLLDNDFVFLSFLGAYIPEGAVSMASLGSRADEPPMSFVLEDKGNDLFFESLVGF